MLVPSAVFVAILWLICVFGAIQLVQWLLSRRKHDSEIVGYILLNKTMTDVMGSVNGAASMVAMLCTGAVRFTLRHPMPVVLMSSTVAASLGQIYYPGSTLSLVRTTYTAFMGHVVIPYVDPALRVARIVYETLSMSINAVTMTTQQVVLGTGATLLRCLWGHLWDMSMVLPRMFTSFAVAVQDMWESETPYTATLNTTATTLIAQEGFVHVQRGATCVCKSSRYLLDACFDVVYSHHFHAYALHAANVPISFVQLLVRIPIDGTLDGTSLAHHLSAATFHYASMADRFVLGMYRSARVGVLYSAGQGNGTRLNATQLKMQFLADAEGHRVAPKEFLFATAARGACAVTELAARLFFWPARLLLRGVVTDFDIHALHEEMSLDPV